MCYAEGGQAADAISIATAKALSFGNTDEQSAFANALAASIAQSGCSTIKPVIASKSYYNLSLCLLLMPYSLVSIQCHINRVFCSI